MIKTTVNIDGMACSMCEAHINDAVRNALAVKSVKSSHKKGIAEIISENPLDEAVLREAIEKTDYRVLKLESAPRKAKKFSLFGR